MFVIFVIAAVLIVVFLILTRTSRRDSAVENRLRRMAAAGQNHAVFNDLYFEAARAYAVAKGAPPTRGDSASAKTVIDGQVYQIYLSRAAGGGTSVLLEEYEAQRDRIKSLMDEMSRTSSSDREIPF
ncbi:hypothetical protein LV780_18045 [Cereibacter azotoformans]|uniref:hypothetical protein n=1 Tax=Cereibacter azotoformans TaxID=43057 RepID=UPI000E358A40|nr:hypothetical protein [Cereibacter azotoformans]AXQ95517.1 hypothetical protein D0Z66_17220 [Cereibacter sphaeroides]UIJ32239.1 hypothetical protein LV780_18045 [Cereibacter azotoformans]